MQYIAKGGEEYSKTNKKKWIIYSQKLLKLYGKAQRQLDERQLPHLTEKIILLNVSEVGTGEGGRSYL